MTQARGKTSKKRKEKKITVWSLSPWKKFTTLVPIIHQNLPFLHSSAHYVLSCWVFRLLLKCTHPSPTPSRFQPLIKIRKHTFTRQQNRTICLCLLLWVGFSSGPRGEPRLPGVRVKFEAAKRKQASSSPRSARTTRCENECRA